MKTYTEFLKVDLNVDRVCALSKLISECEKEGVEIKRVFFCQNGFMVQFEGIPGDAVIHDGSYARDFGEFETIGMPWDYGDVSTHSPEVLAKLLGALKRGEDWEQFDE